MCKLCAHYVKNDDSKIKKHTFLSTQFGQFVKITHFLLTFMEYLSQNKYFNMCQTVHEEEHIQMHNIQFAHAYDWTVDILLSL